MDAAEGIRASHIARWNGSGGWSRLGTNITEAVNVVRVARGYVYAGGYRNGAGFPNGYGLARWDGTNWSSVGGGITNETFFNTTVVNTLAFSGNNLYVGGAFTRAGGMSITNLARWDGTNWFALGGFNGSVNAIAAPQPRRLRRG